MRPEVETTQFPEKSAEKFVRAFSPAPWEVEGPPVIEIPGSGEPRADATPRRGKKAKHPEYGVLHSHVIRSFQNAYVIHCPPPINTCRTISGPEALNA